MHSLHLKSHDKHMMIWLGLVGSLDPVVVFSIESKHVSL
jgi:hypothetical protein